MARQTCTIVCLIRDEAPSLLEWIAWYRLLGADRLVFYDNASRGAGPAMLAALAKADEIEVVAWPDQPGRPPQLDAYAHAIAACPTTWIGFLDADEFLVLPRDGTLPIFLAGFAEDCGAVVFNQRVIGSNGQMRFTPGLLCERFPLGSDEGLWFNSWVKTIARTSCIAAPRIHTARLGSGIARTAGGEPAEIIEDQRLPTISHAIAYYNHYIIKSPEEYAAKRLRGEADQPCDAEHRSRKYSDAFFNAHDVSEWPDATVEALLPKLRAEVARLQAVLDRDQAT
jgi:hypothetical protein